MTWRLLLVSSISRHTAQCQPVTLSFPHDGGKDWVFVLMEGIRSGTVQRGSRKPYARYWPTGKVSFVGGFRRMRTAVGE